jgi:hypothetical protein
MLTTTYDEPTDASIGAFTTVCSESDTRPTARFAFSSSWRVSLNTMRATSRR